MIVAGFGFRASASCESLRSALACAATGHQVTALAAPADKADATCLRDLAAETGLAVHPVGVAELEAVLTFTISAVSRSQRNTGSVAEAAALAAAGPGARLLAARQISQDRRATCALAIRETS